MSLFDQITERSQAWLEPTEFPCTRAGAAGVQRVWVGVRSQLGRWLLEETQQLQFGTIIGSTSTNATFYELPILKGGTSLDEGFSLDEAPSYPITLTVQIAKWDVASRDVAQRIVQYRDALFVVLDTNGTYWLVGERHGCRVSSSAATGQRGGVNAVTLTATCNQPWPLRTVATSWLQGIIIPPLTQRLCDYSFGELCALSFAELCEVPI